MEVVEGLAVPQLIFFEWYCHKMHTVKFTDDKKVRKSKHTLCWDRKEKKKKGEKTLAQHNTVKSQQQNDSVLAYLGMFGYLLVALRHMWSKHLEVLHRKLSSKRPKIFYAALGYTLSDRTPRHELKPEECEHLEYWTYSVFFIHRFMQNEHSEERSY